MYLLTMAAAGAIQRRHLPNGGIQWLLVKPYVLHRVMRPASYCRIRMVIKITSTLPAFFAVVDAIVANNLR
jgi:hypothetical protein